MGTTLDALLANSAAAIDYTVAIEGAPFVLCSGDPDAAFAAYDATSDGYYTDFSGSGAFVGGLSVYWEQDQSVKPFSPFVEPSLVKFSVVPAITDSSSAISDVVGTTVFKRLGGASSSITTAVDCDALSLVVNRADDFAASGLLYVGPETMAYSSRDTGTDTFTLDTRGYFPAFHAESGARYSRTHKPLTATEQDTGIPPVVSSEPRTWVGRWVAVWIHRNQGGTLDLPNVDGSSAHLAFAGQIVEVGDADGATWFTCSDVRRSIYGTRLNKDPFRAKAAEGVWLSTGMTFSVTTTRVTSGGGATATGNDLVVVSSGATGANQVNEGRYPAAELGNILSGWLQYERASSRILFNVTYNGVYDDNGTTRGSVYYHDPTTPALARMISITCSQAWQLKFLGWSSGAISAGGPSQSGTTLSDEVPLRFAMSGPYGDLQSLAMTEPRGTWISQTTLLPTSLRDTNNTIDGVLKVGDLGYVRARRISDTSFQVTEVGMGAFFPGTSSSAFDNLRITVDEQVNLDVQQVLVIDAPFKEVLLKILLSTGTSGFNSTYDVLDENISCGIPYQILGDDFVTEVGNLDCANTSLSAIIDGPRSFHELFEADFILRRCFPVWAAGRLRLKTWATPTSEYASTTLDETSKAAASGTSDLGRASVSESADFYNLVTIRHNIDAEGKFHDELILKDPVSIRLYGVRSREIKARNSFRQVGAIGSPLDELISTFAGYFGFTARPWQIITRSLDFNKFESAYPGSVVLLTDKYLRSPSTGTRYNHMDGTGGLSGFPGMVVGQSFDWGGSEFNKRKPREPQGEVQVMISPQATIAPYVYCAEVDETAANAGYDAGNKRLTTKAHAHSESADVNDNTRFVAGDEVLVVQIDPQTAASAQSWSDVVASTGTNTITLTTGLAGYDTTGATLYRVIYDAYGTVGSTQKTKCYQADDADMMIVDTAQPYGFGFFGSSQSTTVTLSTGQEAPARHSTLAYGDGKPLDVGYERDAVRLANNLINYKTALQSPTINTEVRNFTGSGTYQLVEIWPVFVGMGGFTAGLTRLLSLAPRIRSTDGNTASVRVTYSSRRPTGSTRDDVTRNWPYVTLTFTTTTTANFVISTAQTLDIARGNLADQTMGGVNFIYVEINNKAEYTGLARMKLGALA